MHLYFVLTGAMHMHIEDLKELMDKHYVHKIITADDSGILIFTFVPSLLSLIHEDEVTSFECDVTFKCVLDLNEWEMVIYLLSIQCSESESYCNSVPLLTCLLCLFVAITLARVYTNRATTGHFVLLFDELQWLTELHTGRFICFKHFSPDGNLLVMNADMEAAQILAAGITFLQTNNPDYSKISTTVPEEFVQYFI